MNQEGGGGSFSTCAPLEAPFNDGGLTSSPSFPVAKLLDLFISKTAYLSPLSPRRPSPKIRKWRQRGLSSIPVRFAFCDRLKSRLAMRTHRRRPEGHIGFDLWGIVRPCGLGISRPTYHHKTTPHPSPPSNCLPRQPFYFYFFKERKTTSALPTLASRSIPNRNRTLPRNSLSHSGRISRDYRCLCLRAIVCVAQ
ncbi:hypothetical protein LX36DRAFT_343236 [Colletotrichum falcatum]|nr:hypothetical protein LX36DRAFT_343236 [Colletotrichum falcatum]